MTETESLKSTTGEEPGLNSDEMSHSFLQQSLAHTGAMELSRQLTQKSAAPRLIPKSQGTMNAKGIRRIVHR